MQTIFFFFTVKNMIPVAASWSLVQNWRKGLEERHQLTWCSLGKSWSMEVIISA